MSHTAQAFFALLLQKLPLLSRERMQQYLDDPELLGSHLVRGFSADAALTKVWRTITIDPAIDGPAYVREIEGEGWKVGDDAKKFLLQQTLKRDAADPTGQYELDLVVLSGTDLGFPQGFNDYQAHQAGLDRGYQLCPPATALALRLAYPDQPGGEYLHVAMEPMRKGDESHRFDVTNCGNDLWVELSQCTVEESWEPDNLFVFVRPRSFMEQVPLWRTLAIADVPLTHEDCCAQLLEAGVLSGEWVQEVFPRIPFADMVPGSYDLVRLSATDLGFTEKPTRGQLYKAAQDHGFELCPQWLGPLLRLGYLDQPPQDKMIYVAMSPMTDDEGYQQLFCLAHNMGMNKLRLDVENGDPAVSWELDKQFVFIRPPGGGRR